MGSPETEPLIIFTGLQNRARRFLPTCYLVIGVFSTPASSSSSSSQNSVLKAVSARGSASSVFICPTSHLVSKQTLFQLIFIRFNNSNKKCPAILAATPEPVPTIYRYGSHLCHGWPRLATWMLQQQMFLSPRSGETGPLTYTGTGIHTYMSIKKITLLKITQFY